jgi:hypothetical protein
MELVWKFRDKETYGAAARMENQVVLALYQILYPGSPETES